MITISSNIGDFNVFSEGMILTGSEKVFVEETDDLLNYPEGIKTITRSDAVFLSGTIGFLYTYQDLADNFDLSIAAQYYYNGLGYEDPNLFFDRATEIKDLYRQDLITRQDLLERGQHYGVASLGWNGLLKSDFSLKVFWIGNLLDSSGKVDGCLAYNLDDYLIITAGLSQFYGAKDSEFALNGRQTVFYIKITVGTGNF
jgi:hypothetical protein